jgi:rubrerythrin
MAIPQADDRQYPEWYCEECGKLLKIEPCPHCEVEPDTGGE